MKIVKSSSIKNKEIKLILEREASPSPEIHETVMGILADVKTNGLKAVESYAKKFDGLKGKLQVTPSELSKAAAQVKPGVKRAIDKAIINVKRFHKHQMEKSWMIQGPDGEKLGQRIRPLKRVGVYIPGGSGVYPSTVIMNVVPALVAGVEEIVAVSPPINGFHPAVAYALEKLGVKEIYKVGGAQSIALLAYGAGKIAKVDKIVGPSSPYASVAKKEVFGLVDIDMVAGPSEILVMFDETADPDWVAADILSQAEHGSGYEAAVAVTTSKQAAEWVSQCVQEQIESSPKREILQKTIEKFGRIFVVEDWDKGVALVNHIAPEHLEIITEDAKALSNRIENAGAIFVGPWSSEPVGDYFAGPNHVLPTNGTARFFSPLGVYDFLKRTSIIEYSHQAIQKHGKKIAELADEEGFIHHAAAVRKRLK